MKYRNENKLLNFLESKKKIPIIILDEVFLNKFPKDKKNSIIISLEELLKDKIKQEASLINENKDLKIKKKLYLSDIIILSEQMQIQTSDKYVIMMNELQTKIHEMNNKIIKNEDLLLKMPKEIEKANIKLVEEIVKVCYNVMRVSETEIEVLTPKLEDIREKLSKTMALKTMHQEDFNNTYNLLHNLVGQDVINFLDEEYKTKEDKKWF